MRTMQTVRTSTDTDNIVTVWLDQPGKSVNTLTPLMLTELSEVVTIWRTQQARPASSSPRPKRRRSSPGRICSRSRR